jgi:beta-glucanase (GH16 family)
MDWIQDQVKIYIDNNLVLTVAKADVGTNYPFNNPFFFIFNVAVGGNWPGSPDGTTTFPQRMIVDYVRVFQ